MKHLSIYLSVLLFAAATTLSAQAVFTLDEAVASARQNNNDLQKKRLDVQSMKEQKKEIFTKYFPTIGMSVTAFTREKGLFQGTNALDGLFTLMSEEENFTAENVQILKQGYIGGLRMVQPIYTGGRLTSANKLAGIGVKAYDEMASLKENEITQEVEKYFWQLVQLYEAEKSLLTMDTLVEHARHDAALALKAGLVTPNDEMQVNLYGTELESMRLQVENGKNLCREYLAYLLGVETVDSLLWNDIYNVKEPLTYFADPETSLLDRHELNLLKFNLEAAQQKRKFYRGELLPTVGAMFALSYHYLYAKRDGGAFNNVLDQNKVTWILAANVSIPITAWWGGSHTLSRHNIAVREARMDYDDKQKLMRVQISQKWNTLNEKYKQVDLARRQLEQAEQNRKQHASAYRSGSATMTDRLHADALYEKSRTHYIDACVKYRLAVTEYLHATGR